MAILNVLKFRGIMLRGGFPEAPAEEFVVELDETLEREIEGLATKADLERVKGEIISRLEQKTELLILGLEARQARQMLTWLGVVLGAIAIGVGIILGFN